MTHFIWKKYVHELITIPDSRYLLVPIGTIPIPGIGTYFLIGLFLMWETVWKKRNVVPDLNFGNEPNCAKNEPHQYPMDFRMVYGSRDENNLGWFCVIITNNDDEYNNSNNSNNQNKIMQKFKSGPGLHSAKQIQNRCHMLITGSPGLSNFSQKEG